MVWNKEQTGIKCAESLRGLILKEGDMAFLMISSMLWQEELERKDDSHG